MTTVVSKRHITPEPDDVYIGRPSPWGNPFTHLPGKTLAQFTAPTREAAIGCFEFWIRESPDVRAFYIREHVHELRGRRLVCWCAPKPCHGDVLAKLADG